MGLDKGRTITPQWKGSNPMTSPQIRWRGKDSEKKCRRSDVGNEVFAGLLRKKTAEQLGVVGRGSCVFRARRETCDR